MNKSYLEIRANPLYDKRMYRVEWRWWDEYEDGHKYVPHTWNYYTDGSLDFKTVEECKEVALEMHEWVKKEPVNFE